MHLEVAGWVCLLEPSLIRHGSWLTGFVARCFLSNFLASHELTIHCTQLPAAWAVVRNTAWIGGNAIVRVLCRHVLWLADVYKPVFSSSLLTKRKAERRKIMSYCLALSEIHVCHWARPAGS